MPQLADEGKQSPARAVTPFDRITAAVAVLYEKTPIELREQTRLIEIARPRQIAMYLQYTLTKSSYPKVARYWLMNHTTVVHAVREIGKRRLYDLQLNNRLKFLEGRLCNL